MSKLTYSVITSLDGYVADERGNFTWAAPDEEVHGFINDLERPVGTYLYGRRLYEVMRVWETMPAEPDEPIIEDYTAIWRAADKVVYSTTLPEVTTPRTRLQRSFDPADVQRLKADGDRDVSIGGPTLAASALEAQLVDEINLFMHPVVVGGGTAALPSGLRLDLRLREERRFASGVVYLRYETKQAVS